MRESCLKTLSNRVETPKMPSRAFDSDRAQSSTLFAAKNDPIRKSRINFDKFRKKEQKNYPCKLAGALYTKSVIIPPRKR